MKNVLLLLVLLLLWIFMFIGEKISYNNMKIDLETKLNQSKTELEQLKTVNDSLQKQNNLLNMSLESCKLRLTPNDYETVQRLENFTKRFIKTNNLNNN